MADTKNSRFSLSVRAAAQRRRGARATAAAPSSPRVDSSVIYASVFQTRSLRFSPSGPRRIIGRAQDVEELEPVLSLLEGADGDHYERLHALGSGGMADVELVIDRKLGRRAAKKVIRSELAGDPMVMRNFLREAQITSQLEHPYVVPVHSMGRQADGRVFITMKYVYGETLHQRIRALPSGPLDRARLLELLDVVIKVCEALAAAHEQGILHRDVKPANVMIGSHGRVYLLDWGLAQRTRVDPASVYSLGYTLSAPEDGTIVGTPAYMAPEQALGHVEHIGPATDVFGVGAMLYELVCREPPYASGNLPQTMLAASEGRFDAIDVRAPWVPRPLSRLITKAMAFAPADRHASVAALRDDLVAFTRGTWAFPERHYPAGATIIAQGDPGHEAYAIVSGRCRVSTHKEGVLREMQAGDVFGETAIFAGTLRTATVVALEPTTVIVVDRAWLEESLAALDPWIARFIQTLARRFSGTGIA